MEGLLRMDDYLRYHTQRVVNIFDTNFTYSDYKRIEKETCQMEDSKKNSGLFSNVPLVDSI